MSVLFFVVYDRSLTHKTIAIKFETIKAITAVAIAIYFVVNSRTDAVRCHCLNSILGVRRIGNNVKRKRFGLFGVTDRTSCGVGYGILQRTKVRDGRRRRFFRFDFILDHDRFVGEEIGKGKALNRVVRRLCDPVYFNAARNITCAFGGRRVYDINRIQNGRGLIGNRDRVMDGFAFFGKRFVGRHDLRDHVGQDFRVRYYL